MTKNFEQNLIPGTYLFIPPAPKNYVSELACEFQVDKRTVQNALKLRSYSQKAELIRQSYYKKWIRPYIKNNI